MRTIILILPLILLPFTGMAEDSAAEAIEQRKAAFEGLKENTAAVKDAMKAKDFAAAKTAAIVIQTNANAVTELFPEGSYEGDTRAKKKIWDKWDDFSARQQQLIADADALVLATDSNDPKELKSAFKAVSKNCKACHMRYRQVF